eukprot:CAMPEP_0197825688 /NCGR_PEP_ID=MMETSP1437-20131217/2735_1 /TAXON_ID=49252 ORGANISM="Eucampia antarctica, Strain CCMP1452" /NCGR_SAMPLE_ID=MMETSP1437 /ASSEMBLY_ACC=CAM_ASM_001096 /LENGTH=195 /DNA_ID=CAMNT_0043425799 /DNA_START=150 /DNA_END=737 /DNA_ORIENTATION=-
METKSQQQPIVSMSLWKQISSFIRERTGDFVKLENSDDEFGPGPVILLYGCPSSIPDDELMDMIADGAPLATQKHGKVMFGRILSNDDTMLDSTVLDVLQRVTQGRTTTIDESTTIITAVPFPVIYFSGISNTEMMQTYNIVAEEIFKETGGIAKSACAKAVEPAMGKTLREVIDQITGDHQDAVSTSESSHDTS